MNDNIKKLIDRVGTDSSGKWISIDKAEELVKLTVTECLSAINHTNRHHVYTTYDQQMVAATIVKSKEAVKNHFRDLELEQPIIGYTEREEGFYPLRKSLPGSIVTQAFILCKYCKGSVSSTGGPKNDAVCIACYESPERRECHE